jgi:hypothetical protein
VCGQEAVKLRRPHFPNTLDDDASVQARIERRLMNRRVLSLPT